MIETSPMPSGRCTRHHEGNMVPSRMGCCPRPISPLLDRTQSSSSGTLVRSEVFTLRVGMDAPTLSLMPISTLSQQAGGVEQAVVGEVVVDFAHAPEIVLAKSISWCQRALVWVL